MLDKHGTRTMEDLTAAGLALCAALGINCRGSYDLTVVQPPHLLMDYAHHRMITWPVPDRFVYPVFVSCPDRGYEGEKLCGFGMECVIIAQYKYFDGSTGHTRVCRDRAIS